MSESHAQYGSPASAAPEAGLKAGIFMKNNQQHAKHGPLSSAESPNAASEAVNKAVDAMIENSNQEQSSTSGVSHLRVVNVADLLKMDLPELKYILRPVIPDQGLAMLYAPRGLGKTWAALSIAYAVASGQTVFGEWEAERPRRVLYLDGEMPATIMRERLAYIAAGYAEEPPDADYLQLLTPDLQSGRMPYISRSEGQADLEQFIQAAELIVVDNIATLGRYGRENESESWTPVQDWLLRLRRSGKAVLLVHHAGKNGEQRGTSAREDILDTVIAMRRPGDYQAEEGARFEVHLDKARGICGQEAKPFEAALRIEGDRATWTTRQMEDALNARILALHKEGRNQADIAKVIGKNKSTVSRRLKSMGEGGAQ